MMKLLQTLLLSTITAYATTSLALPSLQLGGDGSSAWNYDTSTQTWVASGTDSFNISAYANCDSVITGCDPNGSFAWEDTTGTGKTDRYAYLIAAAAPHSADNGLDAFNINVSNSSYIGGGFGNPPLEDTNSLGPHSIYDTYFEIYEFQFDGSIGNIGNTQPGEADSNDTGSGYTEMFGVDIISLLPGFSGIHFDLFTVAGNGRYTPGQDCTDLGKQGCKALVTDFAPFSHDAEWTSIPEPGVLALLGIGLVGLSLRKLTKTS